MHCKNMLKRAVGQHDLFFHKLNRYDLSSGFLNILILLTCSSKWFSRFVQHSDYFSSQWELELDLFSRLVRQPFPALPAGIPTPASPAPEKQTLTGPPVIGRIKTPLGIILRYRGNLSFRKLLLRQKALTRNVFWEENAFFGKKDPLRGRGGYLSRWRTCDHPWANLNCSIVHLINCTGWFLLRSALIT